MAIHCNTRLAPDVLHSEYLGNDDDDDTKRLEQFLPTVTGFSHEDTHIHIQQLSILTVQHDVYLLLFIWKWIIIKVFTLNYLHIK